MISYEEKESAEAQYLTAKADLQSAEAKLEQAKSLLDSSKVDLAYTVITSPIDGIVINKNVNIGQTVAASFQSPTLFQIANDLSKMQVECSIDEADIGKLNVGQSATVYVQAFGDHKFKGLVDSIALTNTMSQSGTKYFRTEILLDTNDTQLYSGLTAHVDIETHKYDNVIKVPSQAVIGRPLDDLPLEIRENSPQIDKNKTYATVVYRYVDDKALVTPVKIGPSDMTHTTILSGITEEDQIIIGPYKVLESLKHDQKVRDERQEETVADANDANSVDVNDVNNVKKADDKVDLFLQLPNGKGKNSKVCAFVGGELETKAKIFDKVILQDEFTVYKNDKKKLKKLKKEKW